MVDLILNFFDSKITKKEPKNMKDFDNELKKLCEYGSDISNKEKEFQNIIENIVEFLLINGKKDPEIFDQFCEYQMLDKIIEISAFNIQSINKIIIKNLGLLIPSLKDDKIIYYFFSSNNMNQIILNLSNNITNDDKDDYLSYYINFLRTISNKLNLGTLKLFFDPESNCFPILDESMRFYNHKDIMIRNTARNVFFSILKLNYKPIISYVCDLPKISIFMLISLNLKRNMILLSTIKKSPTQNNNGKKISELNEIITDDILCIQDIYSMQISKISYIMTNCLFNIALHYLLNNILTRTNVYISYYFLGLFVRNIKEENIKNLIVFLIFSQKLSTKINEFIANGENKENENLLLLSKDIFSRQISSHITLDNYLVFNYSKRFIKSLKYIKDTDDTYKELKDISNYLRNNTDENSYEEKADFCVKKLINERKNIISSLNSFHNFVSISTGMPTEYGNNAQASAFLILFHDNSFSISQENILWKAASWFFVEDEAKSNAASCGFQLMFLYSIIKDNSISPHLKEFLGIREQNKKNNSFGDLIDEINLDKEEKSEIINVKHATVENLMNRHKKNINKVQVFETRSNNNLHKFDNKNIYSQNDVSDNAKKSQTSTSFRSDNSNISNSTDSFNNSFSLFNQNMFPNTKKYIKSLKSLEKNKENIIEETIYIPTENKNVPFSDLNFNELYFKNTEFYKDKEKNNSSKKNDNNILDNSIVDNLITFISMNNVLNELSYIFSNEILILLLSTSSSSIYFQLLRKNLCNTIINICETLSKGYQELRINGEIFFSAFESFERARKLHERSAKSLVKEFYESGCEIVFCGDSNGIDDVEEKIRRVKLFKIPSKDRSILLCLFQKFLCLNELIKQINKITQKRNSKDIINPNNILYNNNSSFNINSIKNNSININNNNNINNINNSQNINGIINFKNINVINNNNPNANIIKTNTELSNNRMNLDFIYDKDFPLYNIEKEFDVEGKVNLKGRNIDIFHVLYKTNDMENYNNYIMFPHQNYLFFAYSAEYINSINKKEKVSYSLIKHKFPLRRIFLDLDRGEPRKLLLYVIGENKQMDITLYFQDIDKVSEAKLLISERKSNMQYIEFSNVNTYFQELSKKYKNNVNY